ncbi:MAG TPA: hypothetical protein VFN44_24005 [Solirubrobacteraceae bacterium]|nr:hypothetical protein [Solirubrobacteraceae bacterium]
MSTRTAILAAVAALAVVVVVLSRGQEPSARLQALEEDRMAAYVPPAGRLVDTESRNEGTALGRPVPARLTRLFALPSADGSAALADARRAAAAAGWTPNGAADAAPLIAGKRLPSGRVELTVSVLEDARLLPKDVTPPALLVSLRHLGP